MISVRKAAMSDLEELIDLYREVSKALLQAGIKQWKEDWNPRLFREKLSAIYIVEMEQQMIGAFMLEKQKNAWGLPIKGPEFYLSKIAIAVELQGKGYVQHVFTYLTDFQRKTGSTIYWDCWAGNQKLQAIYQQYGDFVGVFPEENYKVAIFAIRTPK